MYKLKVRQWNLERLISIMHDENWYFVDTREAWKFFPVTRGWSNTLGRQKSMLSVVEWELLRQEIDFQLPWNERLWLISWLCIMTSAPVLISHMLPLLPYLTIKILCINSSSARESPECAGPCNYAVRVCVSNIIQNHWLRWWWV